MKKLIVLMLVLGLASAANAALTISLDPSGAAVLPAGNYDVDVVSNEDDTPWELYVGVDNLTYGDITGVAKLAAAGEQATVTAIGDAGTMFDIYRLVASDMSDPFDSVKMGTQFTVTVNFTGAAIGEDLKLVLMDANLNEVDSRTFLGVPEPMTIALLGLGGLFLRRRK